MPEYQSFHFHLKRVSPSAAVSGEGVPFECEFDILVERLAALPGMFIELDGSFVLRSQGAKVKSDADEWQMDGMIYDKSVPNADGRMVSRVMWCEIRGQFPQEVWGQVVECFDTPVAELVATRLDQGVTVPVADLFR